MDCYQKIPCQHHDQHTSAFHDFPDVDRAARANVRIAQAWVAQQDPDHQKRFCPHGKYVGFDHSAEALWCCFCRSEG